MKTLKEINSYVNDLPNIVGSLPLEKVLHLIDYINAVATDTSVPSTPEVPKYTPPAQPSNPAPNKPEVPQVKPDPNTNTDSNVSHDKEPPRSDNTTPGGTFQYGQDGFPIQNRNIKSKEELLQQATATIDANIEVLKKTSLKDYYLSDYDTDKYFHVYLDGKKNNISRNMMSMFTKTGVFSYYYVDKSKNVEYSYCADDDGNGHLVFTFGANPYHGDEKESERKNRQVLYTTTDALVISEVFAHIQKLAEQAKNGTGYYGR